MYTQNLVKIEHPDSKRDRKICVEVVVLNKRINTEMLLNQDNQTKVRPSQPKALMTS